MSKPHRLVTPAVIATIVVLIGLIWIDEAVDLPARFFGAPPEPAGRYVECLIASMQIALLGGGLLWYVRRLQKRISDLEAYIVTCSWCRRIKSEGQWVPLEHFLKHQHAISTSHGICPDCAKTLKANRYGSGMT